MGTITNCNGCLVNGSYSPQAMSQRYAPNPVSLTQSLERMFHDNLPTMKEFDSGYKQAYVYHRVEAEKKNRPKAVILEGVVNRLSQHAGYTPRTMSRWQKESTDIRDVLGSVKLNSNGKSFQDAGTGFVKGLLDYRNAVETYKTSHPFHNWLEGLVKEQNPNALNQIQARDISIQVSNAPLPAKLYAAVDRSLAKNAPYKESRQEALQSYLALAAFQGAYDAKAIKRILGKEESSTTVARIYGRAGLPFREMKDFFTEYGTMWMPELAKAPPAAECKSSPDNVLPIVLSEKLQPIGNC